MKELTSIDDTATRRDAALSSKMMRDNPIKVITWVAMAEGGNMAMRKFLDSDLSNYLGFGADWGEVLSLLKSASKGEWDAAARHWQLVFNRGTGILPTGPGPAFQAANDIINGEITRRGARWWMRKHIYPTAYRRVQQAIEAYNDQQEGRYPIYADTEVGTKERAYELTGTQILQRTFGPRSASEIEEAKAHYARGLTRAELIRYKRRLADLIVQGDPKQVSHFLNHIPETAIPFVADVNPDSLVEAAKRLNLPRSVRDTLETGQFRFYYELEHGNKGP